jgi:hypothetical protein
VRRLSVAQSLVVAAGTGETAVIVAGLLLAPATLLFLYMVRPGAGEALAQPDEDEIPDEPPQLRACQAARERPTPLAGISLAAMPEDSAPPKPVDGAGHAPR